MKQHYGFWMLLTGESQRRCSQLITDISREYGNLHPFIPHVSVYSSQLIDLAGAKKVVDRVVEDIPVFEMKVETVDYRMDDWSKTLYLKLENNQSLSAISQRLSDRFGVTYELYPHLSLIYSSEMTEAVRLKAIQTIEYPKSIEIGSIGLINPNNSENKWWDYWNWRIDYQKPLKTYT